MSAPRDEIRQRLLHGAQPALVDATSGRTWSYADLLTAAECVARSLPAEPKSLAFCLCSNTAQMVVAYLSCLRAGHAVALLDAAVAPPVLNGLLDAYQPEYVLGAGAAPPGYQPSAPDLPVTLFTRSANSNGERPADIHDALAVLLPTSGTTGSPKMVRLSWGNLLANATAIIDYLGLSATERPITSLPFHYSYGLSVLNSHLLCGATLVLTGEGVLSQHFWEVFRTHGCTSFAGVPYSYHILDRIGFLRSLPPSLRTMTQAGGRLQPELALKYHAALTARGVRFFVMYGQTEATARMAYVPPDKYPEKPGSIGVPIPGGKLSVVAGGRALLTPHAEGELCYEGANVMLGYATQRADLALGDERQGKLLTGDLGYFDEDHFFYVSGRTKRISKVYGLRISLDEVENDLRDLGPVAVISDDQKIVVYHERNAGAAVDALRAGLAERYKLNVNTFQFRHVERLPLKESGKIDYSRLTV